MKQHTLVFTVITLIALCVAGPLNATENKTSAALFPTFDGWTAKGTPAEYNPETLYEYINGAADVFLSYDFKQLFSLSYEYNKDPKLSFTVDVYLHSTNHNAFGIYSQEKPKQGTFLPIGIQGYYEKGILNFLKGSYYVKISGYDLGEQDQTILTTFAEKLAQQLEGATDFPVTLACFPQENKVSGSESYIAQSFLGHAFLGSAFVVDYDINGEKVQLFIIQTDAPDGAANMLKQYIALAQKKGQTVENQNDIHRFVDPYYRNNGKMNLKLTKNFLWGLFSKADSNAETIITTLEKNLKQQKLL